MRAREGIDIIRYENGDLVQKGILGEKLVAYVIKCIDYGIDLNNKGSRELVISQDINNLENTTFDKVKKKYSDLANKLLGYINALETYDVWFVDMEEYNELYSYSDRTGEPDEVCINVKKVNISGVDLAVVVERYYDEKYNITEFNYVYIGAN